MLEMQDLFQTLDREKVFLKLMCKYMYYNDHQTTETINSKCRNDYKYVYVTYLQNKIKYAGNSCESTRFTAEILTNNKYTDITLITVKS